mmetsp:Transcript_9725/g.59034  ORF Transcript_9725/g.59034 Transcript_9725/m.59034 type:complete len:215 (+) Transcript_9725:2871-3515(+)
MGEFCACTIAPLIFLDVIDTHFSRSLPFGTIIVGSESTNDVQLPIKYSCAVAKPRLGERRNFLVQMQKRVILHDRTQDGAVLISPSHQINELCLLCDCEVGPGMRKGGFGTPISGSFPKLTDISIATSGRIDSAGQLDFSSHVLHVVDVAFVVHGNRQGCDTEHECDQSQQESHEWQVLAKLGFFLDSEPFARHSTRVLIVGVCAVSSLFRIDV